MHDINLQILFSRLGFRDVLNWPQRLETFRMLYQFGVPRSDNVFFFEMGIKKTQQIDQYCKELVVFLHYRSLKVHKIKGFWMIFFLSRAQHFSPTYILG